MDRTSSGRRFVNAAESVLMDPQTFRWLREQVRLRQTPDCQGGLQSAQRLAVGTSKVPDRAWRNNAPLDNQSLRERLESGKGETHGKQSAGRRNSRLTIQSKLRIKLDPHFPTNRRSSIGSGEGARSASPSVSWTYARNDDLIANSSQAQITTRSDTEICNCVR